MKIPSSRDNMVDLFISATQITNYLLITYKLVVKLHVLWLIATFLISYITIYNCVYAI